MTWVTFLLALGISAACALAFLGADSVAAAMRKSNEKTHGGKPPIVVRSNHVRVASLLGFLIALVILNSNVL